MASTVITIPVLPRNEPCAGTLLIHNYELRHPTCLIITTIEYLIIFPSKLPISPALLVSSHTPNSCSTHPSDHIQHAFTMADKLYIDETPDEVKNAKVHTPPPSHEKHLH